jgi:hypothetical protein
VSLVDGCIFSLNKLLFLRIYRSVHQYSYVTTVGMGVVTLKDIQNRVGATIFRALQILLPMAVHSTTNHAVVWSKLCYLRDLDFLSILHVWPRMCLKLTAGSS